MTKDNQVTELMKTFGATLTYEDKWLVWDDMAWSVFGKKKYKKNTVYIGSSGKLNRAVDILKEPW